MRFLVKLILTAIVIAVCLWPTWAYLAARGVLNPEGFWQNLAAMIGGVYLLGGAQVVFGIFGLFALFFVWFVDLGDRRRVSVSRSSHT